MKSDLVRYFIMITVHLRNILLQDETNCSVNNKFLQQNLLLLQHQHPTTTISSFPSCPHYAITRSNFYYNIVCNGPLLLPPG